MSRNTRRSAPAARSSGWGYGWFSPGGSDDIGEVAIVEKSTLYTGIGAEGPGVAAFWQI